MRGSRRVRAERARERAVGEVEVGVGEFRIRFGMWMRRVMRARPESSDRSD
jgi:hypothetical protein